jgi:hypothetical protein
MNRPDVVRDERTLSVENASFRWAYLFMTYGALAIVAYRALALKESSWDLLALVVGSGLLTSGYQGLHRVLERRWAVAVLVSFLAAAVVAALAVLCTRPT